MDKESSELKPKLESLQSIVNEVTTELYKNATPPPGPEGQQGAGPEGQQENNTTENTSQSSSSDEQKNN